MQIIPTKDTEVIASVLLNPAIYKDIKGETEFDKESIEHIKEASNQYFLEVQGREGTLGLFYLHEIEPDAYMLHVNMLPEYRGGVAVAALSHMEEWMRYNTRVFYLVSEIPKEYKQIFKFAIDNGYKHYNSEDNNNYVVKELR